ncbi:MAG: hypothetical protein JO224_13290 [Pelomonas sp.]|nr:hypothetical protein [Roseateles sp.]
MEDSWPALALPGLVLVLAIGGALRWDALRLWFASLFSPPPGDGTQPAPQRLDVPRHLDDAALRHQAPPNKPQAHRSGRRG